MKENKIFFKGILGGLEVHIDPYMDLDHLIGELQEKLESSRSFFQGTPVNLVLLAENLVIMKRMNW